MKLKRWLELTGMSQTELAQLASTSISTINRHLRLGRVLDPKVIIRIFFVTYGAVRPDDFYDLETIPPEIVALMISAKASQLRDLHKKLKTERDRVLEVV